MQTRKTQCGWMALGATLFLLGVALVCKLRDSNQASAQSEPVPASVGAAAGPMATGLVLPNEAPPPATLKPVAGTLLQPLSSIFLEEPKAPATPPAPAETAEPPTAPQQIRLVDFEFKEPAKTPAPNRQQPPVPPLPLPPGVAPLPTPMPAPLPALMPPPAEPSLLTPPPPVKPVRFDNQAPSVPIALTPLPTAVAKPAPTMLQGQSVIVPVANKIEDPPPLDPVKPLPTLRARTTPIKPRPMPLTGTYVGSLDERKMLMLPATLREQLVAEGAVLASPGSDTCLWLTTPAHLERLIERLEQSRARDTDVRAFRRLYFAQAEKMSIGSDGRVLMPERLAQFAGLQHDVVLVGIDDHIEVWDAARWKKYTQDKSAAARSGADLE